MRGAPFPFCDAQYLSVTAQSRHSPQWRSTPSRRFVERFGSQTTKNEPGSDDSHSPQHPGKQEQRPRSHSPSDVDADFLRRCQHKGQRDSRHVDPTCTGKTSSKDEIRAQNPSLERRQDEEELGTHGKVVGAGVGGSLFGFARRAKGDPEGTAPARIYKPVARKRGIPPPPSARPASACEITVAEADAPATYAGDAKPRAARDRGFCFLVGGF